MLNNKKYLYLFPAISNQIKAILLIIIIEVLIGALANIVLILIGNIKNILILTLIGLKETIAVHTLNCKVMGYSVGY